MKNTNKLTAFQNGFLFAFSLFHDNSTTFTTVIPFQYTLTSKSLQRKGYVKIKKYRMAKNNVNYETVIDILKGSAEVA